MSLPNMLGPFTQGGAAALLRDIEQSYNVNLAMWIAMGESSSGNPYFEVYVTGSGDLFDHLPAGSGVGRARITSGFDDPFGNALHAALSQLAKQLSRVSIRQV